MLKTYFRSGWAFFIPYLAAYLLYAWLKWPVNPVDGGQRTVVPCLLHVYWTLHAMHLVLGTIAMRFWLRHASLLHSPFSLLLKAAPWLCLALLFYIPGVYLEWPADPWEHYSRVNEWHEPLEVTSHSTWIKTSYFLAYSFIGHIDPPLLQISFFDVYYTCCCLLLCWQYFRLAQAALLEESAAYVFVLLQALLLGNGLFGFYRYYGMSSSVFSQIGAVAIVRVALEAVSGRHITVFLGSGPAAWVLVLTSLSFLSALTAFNHLQGLGVAGLGLGAILAWQSIERHLSHAWWLMTAMLVLSVAAILWYPRSDVVDGLYRTEGWLTDWYGLNMFLPGPTLERTVAILGFFGMANVAAAVWLMPRNHVAAWLTLAPIAALALPCVALPLSSILSSRGPGEIVTFHRVLFGIPSGLALVTLVARWFPPVNMKRALQQFSVAYGLALAALLALCVLPASGPGFNRAYNALMRPPADSNMRHALVALGEIEGLARISGSAPTFVGSAGISYINYSTGRRNDEYPWQDRSIYLAPQQRNVLALRRVLSLVKGKRPAILLPQRATQIFSPASLTGHISGHWPPTCVAFEHVSERDMVKAAMALGFRPSEPSYPVYLIFP